MGNSRVYGICKVNIKRAPYAKHLRSKKQLKTEKVVPKRIFIEEEQKEQTPLKNKMKKKCITLKH